VPARHATRPRGACCGPLLLRSIPGLQSHYGLTAKCAPQAVPYRTVENSVFTCRSPPSGRSSPLARPDPRRVLEQELERYFGPSSARCKASCRATERTWVSTPDGVMVWLSGASPESRPGRAWRRQQLTLRDRASAASFSRSLRVVFPAGAFKAAAPGGLSSGAVSGGAMRRGRRGPCRPRHRTGRYPKTAATVRGTECVQST